MKVCSRCKINKDNDEFRLRLEKRKRRTDKDFYYLNNTCRKCDNDLQKIAYKKKKDDAEFKEKNKKRAKEYAKKNAEKCKIARKKYRETHREQRKKWESENREKIKNKHRPVSRRWAKKQIKEVSDNYVITQLCHPRNKIKSRGEIKNDKQLLGKKKKSILVHRLKKQIKKLNNEEQN